MASVPMVLQQLRRARRQAATERNRGQFEEYEADYRQVLRATESVADEDALDDLLAWATDLTAEKDRLPTPDEFEQAARSLLRDRGLEIPADFPHSE